MKSLVLVGLAAVIVAVPGAGVAADPGGVLKPLGSRTLLTPEGRDQRVSLRADVPGGAKVTFRSIVARGGGKTYRGTSSVKLPPGRYTLTRRVSWVTSARKTITPARGQCVVTGGRYSDILDGYGDLYVACTVDGLRATGEVNIYQLAGPNVLSLRVLPEGSDLLEALADTANYDHPTADGGPMPVPSLSLEVESPVSTARRTDRVTVKSYNPGCVTGSEASRLRIGMPEREAVSIIGGRGTLLGRAAGVQVRRFDGCWWAAVDAVTVRFAGGVVDAYAIVR